MQVVTPGIELINEQPCPGTLSAAVLRKDNQPECKHIGSIKRNRNVEQFTPTWSSHGNISARELIIVFLLQINIPSTWI